MQTVVIDAGHGGADSGAVGSNGTREKDVALKIALFAAKQLEAYEVKVVLTRDDDHFETLSNRAKISNDSGANLFISCHLNAGANGKSENPGYEVFTTPGETLSDRAAGLWVQNFRAARPNDRHRAGESGEADKEANFAVLRATAAPAILCEFAFIDSVAGERLCMRKDFVEACGHSVARTAIQFLALKFSDVPTPAPVVDHVELVRSELIADAIDKLRIDIKALERLLLP